MTPHTLRHTFATLALQKGIALASVQKALGHDRLETTAIYLNFTDAHVIEEFSNSNVVSEMIWPFISNASKLSLYLSIKIQFMVRDRKRYAAKQLIYFLDQTKE